MKKLYLLTLLAAMISFTTFNRANAQAEFPVASFDDNMILTIPSDVPLTQFYTIDISGMDFKDAAAADRFFRSMTDNLVRANVDFAAQKATLQIMTQYTESMGWGLTEWNNYFVSVSERYQGAFDNFNE